MIQLDDVSKKFGSLMAVDHVSLKVGAGAIFGLVGPDGAGKTTLIRLLTGLLGATTGTIGLLKGKQPLDVRNYIGYVPQKFSLYGDLTVWENIELMGSLYGKAKQEIINYGEKVLTLTHLISFRGRLADQLSGGMKQKLALAAGLMHGPEILFLDEPTTGVDPVSRREFWQMLYQLNKAGMTIFVSTPYMDEAELCHRIAFMDHGRIISSNTPGALKETYPYKVLELIAPSKKVKQILAACPVRDVNAFGDKYHLVVEDVENALTAVREALAAAQVQLISCKQIAPTLEDVFVALAGEGV